MAISFRVKGPIVQVNGRSIRNDNEIKNPVAHIVIIMSGLLIVAIVIGISTFFSLGFSIVAIPLIFALVPLHFLLRAFGMRGFYYSDGHNTAISLKGAFNRRN